MDASSNALGFGIAVDKANIKGLSLNNGLLVLRNNTAVLQPPQVAKCLPPAGSPEAATGIPGGCNRNFWFGGFAWLLLYPKLHTPIAF